LSSVDLQKFKFKSKTGFLLIQKKSLQWRVKYYKFHLVLSRILCKWESHRPSGGPPGGGCFFRGARIDLGWSSHIYTQLKKQSTTQTRLSNIVQDLAPPYFVGTISLEFTSNVVITYQLVVKKASTLLRTVSKFVFSIMLVS